MNIETNYIVTDGQFYSTPYWTEQIILMPRGDGGFDTNIKCYHCTDCSFWDTNLQTQLEVTDWDTTQQTIQNNPY